MKARVPTSLLAATGLIAGFGVAVGTGSRPLGGLVMAAFGLTWYVGRTMMSPAFFSMTS
jgi:hypothetical protein